MHRDYSGENNPNIRHFYNRDYFKNIDSPRKAYLLGWIASDGTVNNKRMTLSIHKKDEYILRLMAKDMGDENIVKRQISRPNMSRLSIVSIDMANDICSLLNINPGKKSGITTSPNIDEKYMRDFVRGYFDGDGTIRVPKLGRFCECQICTISDLMKNWLTNYIKFPSSASKKGVTWQGNNALDFLSWMYDDSGDFKLIRKYQRYRFWANYVHGFKTSVRLNGNIIFRYKKLLSEAISPFKAHGSDSGFDLSLVKLISKSDNVYIYDTGIAIQPDWGWYMDVVPRSSLYKSGFYFLNSVGVIDRSYLGTIKVTLLKYNTDIPDPELPFRAVQMIPRPIINPELVEVSDDKLSITYDSKKIKGPCVLGGGDNHTMYVSSRGDRGFGSSGR